jgi:hypothetical protein
VEVRVVDQGSELVNPLSQPVLRPQLPDQRHHLSQHQEPVSVAGIVPSLSERQLDLGEDFIGWLGEHEIEGRGAGHAEI